MSYMKSHAYISPFLKPVEVNKLPKYVKMISQPIDLSAIERKIIGNEYKQPWDFIGDVNLMFQNCWKFNNKKSRLYGCCTQVIYLMSRNTILEIFIIKNSSFRSMSTEK